METITVYMPVTSGRRAHRLRVPRTAVFESAALEPERLAAPRRLRHTTGYVVQNRAEGGRQMVALRFSVLNAAAIEDDGERLFRLVPLADREDHRLQLMKRSLQLVVNSAGEETWELVEMWPNDKGARVSDIKRLPVRRGLNKLAIPGVDVVRVNGIASRGLSGRSEYPFEVRYQTRRRMKSRADVHWVYVGLESDVGRPASLVWWCQFGKDGRFGVWLSAGLIEVANDV